MDLIDRAAYCAEMRSRQEACYKAYEDAKNEAEREHWSGVYTAFVEAKLTLDKLPTIEAVPLDKLCRMLAKYIGFPCNYSPIDEEMADYCGDKCEMDDMGCWKKVLSKWMEENDADGEREG